MQVICGRSISEAKVVDPILVITFSLIKEHNIVSSAPNNKGCGQFLIHSFRLDSGKIQFDSGKIHFDSGKIYFDSGKIYFDSGKIHFDSGKNYK